ncbi:MAG: hypothetical protein K9J06_07940 [Flavobacteriales bacterium]|nr:hypothetical protein [Flavobacteriales bacterium]
MNATHFHLVFTHFPIVGTIIAIFILAIGLFFRNDSISKVALALMAVMAVLSIPVFLTGEGAEESVEKLAGVSETLMEEHEELAEKAIWLMGLLGVSALISLFTIIGKSGIARTLTLVTLALSIITFGLFVKVGSLGGQIRHSEIRDSSIVQATDGQPADLQQDGTAEEDDDD